MTTEMNLETKNNPVEEIVHRYLGSNLVKAVKALEEERIIYQNREEYLKNIDDEEGAREAEEVQNKIEEAIEALNQANTMTETAIDQEGNFVDNYGRILKIHN